MKKTKILSLVLAFLMMLTSVGVFAEETTETPCQLSESAVELRDNIAEAICDTEDGWTAFTMAAYERYSLGSAKMSDETKHKITDAYINEATGDSATASDRSRIEIVLSALGKDATSLYPVVGEKVNNSQLLSLSDLLASGHYAAPWILLANLQGNTNLEEEQIQTLIEVLDQAKGDGTFGYEWDGIVYADADTAGATLAALAPLYETNENAQELADYIVAGLENTIYEDGSFGSANSDAMVIIGLLAIGENPYEFKNETTQKSVVDGLLSYANEGNNAFTFYGSENYMATEQGLRALIALSAYEGEKLNIYDFSENEKTPAYQYSLEKIITLRDNIASAICNTEDIWTAFTMAVYEEYTSGTASMSDETKKNLINQMITSANGDSATAGDRAKFEIVLRSLGIDTKNLYPSGVETPVNNGEKLKNADLLASGHYSAPWILLADMQGNTELSEEQIVELVSALDAAKGTGLFESEWDGFVYTDADTASVTLSALARYYGTKEEATQLCDIILEALKNAIDENGSFGNANSDAMVIIGLASMGINPYEFRNATTKKSIVDGLLSYANDANNAFTFYGSENYMATEQGLRALIALSAYDGTAYNIYDFSEMSVAPGYEITEEAETPETPETPEEPETPVYSGGGSSSGKNNKKEQKPEPKPEPEKTEQQEEKPVTITFKDISQHWAKDAVSYVAEKGIMNGISEENFAPDEKLTRGMIVTMLYRLSGDNVKGENKFTDVSKDAWFADAVVWASENGIADGYGNGIFGADDEVTREQLAVLLKRYADLKSMKFDTKDTQAFKDENYLSLWAEDAVLWAKDSGILSGREDKRFYPKQGATRAEIAMVFMRFVENQVK